MPLRRLCSFLFILAVPALATLLLAGCATTKSKHDPRVIKPVLAVTSFENRANFSGKWNLGDGMADLMITELLDAERFVVLERKYLGDVIGEIVMQGRELFRSEGKVGRGRLKNAQYHVRGVITDFTVTNDSSGWFASRKGRAWAMGSKARVAMNVYVTDIESGEIIISVKSQGSARRSGFGGSVNYQGMAFGGETFFQTPLGSATEQAMRDAVKRVVHQMPVLAWQPRVAEGGPDLVVVNGGSNVGLAVGDRFNVRAEGRRITDPITGNVIDVMPGRVKGLIQIQSVGPAASQATLLEGSAQRGDLLETLR